MVLANSPFDGMESLCKVPVSGVDAPLDKCGALLFRGFGVDSALKLSRVANAVTRDVINYTEQSSPRKALGLQVYTSTEHPADQEIALHTEQSYTLSWPLRIWFACSVRAGSGGATPLADTRKVLARISQSTRSRFAELGVQYIRNYRRPFGLPWQQAMGVDTKADAEAFCASRDIRHEWKDDGTLRTWQVRPAIRRHPRTGEEVWFNHAWIFNSHSMEASIGNAINATFPDPTERPTHTRFGDGTEIPEEMLLEVGAAYAAEAQRFLWESGDALLIDNMLVAHGRDSFHGRREILVAMAEPMQGDPMVGVWARHD